MSSEWQVVAVYPSGRRYPVRAPHETFLGAHWHREACEAALELGEAWGYEIDVRYVGVDGQIHWRGNVSGESLGYSLAEL